MAFQGYTLPAPSGGVNLVDSIDNMEPNNSLELTNIFPTGLGGEVRKGYTSGIATGEGLQINSLSSFPLQSGTTKLVGTAGAKIWEFSTGAAVNITGATPLTDSNCQTYTFGNRFFICNGVDTVQVYDGATTVDSTFSGVTLSTLINVSSHKERLYFVKKNTTQFWYGNSGAIGGSALNSYDVGYFLHRGGYLLFAGAWTAEFGTLYSDVFYTVSSEGEILCYHGTYPGDVTTPWQLVARYVIGKPLGYRSWIRVNDDVWIITEQGIVQLSALFNTDPEDALQTVGRKVNPAVVDAANSIGFSHLWHGHHYPQGRKVFLTIPQSGSSNLLAVYGQDAKGWCIYQLYNAGDCVSICSSAGKMYFGSSDGKVYQAESGYNDNGQAITFMNRGSYSFFGTRGNFKTFKDIRPLMKTIRGSTFSLGLDTNFQQTTDSSTISVSAGTFTAWDSAWDSAWSGESEYIYDRYATKGQGHSASIRFSGSIKDAPLELYGFEVRFELGGQV